MRSTRSRVFGDAVAFHGGLIEAERIEGFEPFLLGARFGGGLTRKPGL